MQRAMSSARTAFSLLCLSTLLCGVAYPAIVTLFAQSFFSHSAKGSLIEKDGKVIGSRLLGQSFSEPKYFWGRLSATTPPYNAAASAGSNLSPANAKLLEAANVRIAALQKADPKNNRRIPGDLITASASGLDSEISIASAEYQLPRVARVRKMKEEDVLRYVRQAMSSKETDIFGDPRVNVLMLNMALDETQAKK